MRLAWTRPIIYRDNGVLPGIFDHAHAAHHALCLMTAPRLPDPAFWRGKQVLLTGHTGFKGAWALTWLHKMGARVTGLALAPEHRPSLFEMIAGDALARSLIADLRVPADVDGAVRSAAPDVVLHLAAQPIVRRAIGDPVEAIAVNALGTAHLLDAVRRLARPMAVLVVTSDKVYANDEAGRDFVESDRLGGRDPYSASKAAAELIAASFAATYFDAMEIPLATARCGNIIGGGDYAADRIVPDVLRAAEAGQALMLRHPSATRPWLHVLDGVCGYLLFAERLATGGASPRALNFGPGPGAPVPVAQVAEMMQAALGVTTGWRHAPAPGSVEMKTLGVGSALARRELGWVDLIRGEERIAWTADWHRQVAGGADARATCLAQIAAFEALAGSLRAQGAS